MRRAPTGPVGEAGRPDDAIHHRDDRDTCDVHRRGTLRWKGHRSCGRDLHKPGRAGTQSQNRQRPERDRVIGRDDGRTETAGMTNWSTGHLSRSAGTGDARRSHPSFRRRAVSFLRHHAVPCPGHTMGGWGDCDGQGLRDGFLRPRWVRDGLKNSYKYFPGL